MYLLISKLQRNFYGLKKNVISPLVYSTFAVENQLIFFTNMKSQIYLCVDLKAMTQDTHFRPQESRTGVLSMQDEDNFIFYEAQAQKQHRNPRLWSGKMLNISQKTDGSLSINFKPLCLEPDTNTALLVSRIYFDLLQAKKDLIPRL